jgi:hypothetical protein
MGRWAASALAGVALVSAALLTSPAGSEEARGLRPARAPEERQLTLLRVTFAEGIGLENAGRWADALEKFEIVARGRETAAVRFHIGLCHQHLGRLRLAERAYLDARSRAGAGSSVAEEATERLADLSARFPKLVLQVIGDRTGLTVHLDGAPVATGAPLTVDPGPHVAVALRRGVPVAAVAFSAHERKPQWITLRAIDRPRAQPVARAKPIARATASR